MTAAQKAYARRAHRSAAVAHAEKSGPVRTVRSMLTVRIPTSRASFVLLMMVLLSAGVALTMWLSTQAISDSYRLESVRTETATLAEQVERLQREVARQGSAASLAERAKDLGMVPSSEPARILVTTDGETTVVGEPRKARSNSGTGE